MKTETLLLRMLVLPALTVGIILGGLGDATAGTQDQAVVAVHASSGGSCTAKGAVNPVAIGLPCTNYTTTTDPYLTFTYVYLVVALGDTTAGIAGVTCGVSYDYGSATWTKCADGLEFPSDGGNGDWPASEGGNNITWSPLNSCQRTVVGSDGVQAVAGFFTLSAGVAGTGSFQITANQNVAPAALEVADCDALKSTLGLGAAGRIELGPPGSGDGGCNPCVEDCLGPVPVRPSSWGEIKSLYSSGE